MVRIPLEFSTPSFSDKKLVSGCKSSPSLQGNVVTGLLRLLTPPEKNVLRVLGQEQ